MLTFTVGHLFMGFHTQMAPNSFLKILLGQTNTSFSGGIILTSGFDGVFYQYPEVHFKVFPNDFI